MASPMGAVFKHRLQLLDLLLQLPVEPGDLFFGLLALADIRQRDQAPEDLAGHSRKEAPR